MEATPSSGLIPLLVGLVFLLVFGGVVAFVVYAGWRGKQEKLAPAVHAAPLPRVVRRDLRAEIDWRFGGTLSAVMLAFFFLGLAAEAADPLVELSPPESVFAFRPLYEAPEPPAPDMPAEPTLTDEEPVVADATPTPTRDQTRGPSPREHAGPSTASDEGTPRLTREEARNSAGCWPTRRSPRRRMRRATARARPSWSTTWSSPASSPRSIG